MTAPDREGVLLSRRERGPCQGLWHIPGGTVRFGEALTEAVQRVPREELGLEVAVGSLIGYIEYPSHLALGDWPVGIAFRAELSASGAEDARASRGPVAWFTRLPEDMHEEQRLFLRAHGLAF
jgi:ADP-ribose pyrophosphatase YjhB (NUDIX family)